MADYADDKADDDPRPRKYFRFYTVIFFALLICTIFITNNLTDILNPTVQDAAKAKVYWFMNVIGDGQRILNRVGYYYLVLNFCLLFLTLLGIACFLSLSAEVFRTANAENVERIDSFDELYVRLYSFIIAYILAKGLAACYAVNFFIWAVSPLGKTGNLLVSQIAITVVGVFFYRCSQTVYRA